MDPCGTVYKLTPPAAHQTSWTESVIYSFAGGADGGFPFAGLFADTRGNLYGTTDQGGAPNDAGTVFELSPPNSGKTTWSHTVIHTFSGGADGYEPSFGRLIAGDGALLGTAQGGGAYNRGLVFKLSPPTRSQVGWAEAVLYDFGGDDGSDPSSGLTIARGALYGTTNLGGVDKLNGSGFGVVFRLMPPRFRDGAWTERVLHVFSNTPDGAFINKNGLVQGLDGALYGTTFLGGAAGQGIVYRQSI